MNNEIQTALLYCGIHKPDEASAARAARILDLLSKTIQPRLIWSVHPLIQKGDEIWIEDWDLPLEGQMASHMLKNCSHVITLAVTLTSLFDQQLLRLQARDMSEALFYDACGSVYLESFLDRRQEEIAARFAGSYLTDRFSCGYGDLPLALQKEIAARMQLDIRCGISVSNSCMMNPTKSVTAFIGISDQPQPARIRGCAYCTMRENCPYRKEGKRCEIS